MYTVPKLEDYSPEALDRAVADLFAALDAESGDLHSESDWKAFRDRWLARKNGVLTQINDTWLKAAPGPAKREVAEGFPVGFAVEIAAFGVKRGE